MKDNVITHALMAPFGPDGSLEIIGTKEEGGPQDSVVFLAKGDMARWLYHSQPEFCKKCITTWAPDHSATTMLIFEYRLRSELRNPQKLLKSVRNKLMQAVRAIQQKHETEYYEEYVQPYLSSHMV